MGPDSRLHHPPARRHLFIDLYRSFVILLMLEGHLLRTVLPSGTQRTSWFELHEFIHGLSAPAFLFGAGLTFVISTRKRWVSYHHWDDPLARRVRRFILVIGLGLALHLPYFSFRKLMLEGSASDYLQFWQFDVLHTIGIGLLSLHALVFFFRSQTKFYGLVLTTIIAVCFLTPLVWDVDFLVLLPVPIAQMLNGNHGSPFPLFPYVGFLYVGVIVSWEFLIAAEKNTVSRFMASLFFFGSMLILGGVLLDMLPVRMYPTYNYWYTSPDYFFVRVGALMMLTAGSWYLSHRFATAPAWLTVLGRESLFVYVLHLVVLYGSVVNPAMNLQAWFGGTIGPAGAAGMILLFIIAMLGCALVWSWMKQRQPLVYRIVQVAAGGTFLYLFFTNTF